MKNLGMERIILIDDELSIKRKSLKSNWLKFPVCWMLNKIEPALKLINPG
jgi:hypothetical protein